MKKPAKPAIGRREFLRTLGAGATAAAAAAGPLAGEARADTETNDEKRKARYKAELCRRCRPSIASTAIRRSEEGPMLIKRTERQARRGSLAGALQGQAEAARPPLLPAPLRPRGRRPRSARHAVGRQRAQGAGRSAARRRRAGHHPQEHLHPLFGRLHGDRRSLERRVDRPGARLGFADQSRLALRQGRGGARARARRPATEISDEARQRRVDPDHLGQGDRRDRRQADGDPREVGRRIRSIGSAPRSSPTKAPT